MYMYICVYICSKQKDIDILKVARHRKLNISLVYSYMVNIPLGSLVGLFVFNLNLPDKKLAHPTFSCDQ